MKQECLFCAHWDGGIIVAQCTKLWALTYEVDGRQVVELTEFDPGDDSPHPFTWSDHGCKHFEEMTTSDQ